MSSRALRKLRGNDLDNLHIPGDISDEEDECEPSQNKKNKKKNRKPQMQNLFDLLGEEGDDQDIIESVPSDENNDQTEDVEQKPDLQPATNTKRKKKKKKKAKERKEIQDTQENVDAEEDEIDAGIREVNRILNNGNIGEVGFSVVADHDVNISAMCRALLSVEHRNLNPETELKRIFGSRVLREEGMRRRSQQARRRQRPCWMATPKDSWPPTGRTGLTMQLKETRGGIQYYIFEHSHSYQKIQLKFYDAVESLNPQNIGDILQEQPYHIDAIIQLSEVFRMNEDMNMAAELIERALYAMEMAFHPLFNLATGTCRVEYQYRENRSLFLALFKHIASLGQRGCNKTALEFCKLLLSLDPDNDPVCALLLIDFYAIRATNYEFLIRLYEEWEAHRNLSQLPNFAFSLPLAYFLQAEGDDLTKADNKLQDSLLMFPGMLIPLLEKCGIQADSTAHHPFFKQAEFSEPAALKQLMALYVGRCHACWKVPDVMEWLERNVKEVTRKVDDKDARVETYTARRQSRYKGTPRNIYRHILISEIPSATATLPPDVASTVLSYDPLPPLDTIEAYNRPSRPNRAQTDGNAMSMFLRSLLPNFNPNEPVVEGGAAAGGAGQGEGQQLRQGVGALMGAMRDLLNNIRMVEPPADDPNAPNDGQAGADPPPPDEYLDEWD